ncbi:hypothetical protein Sango_2760700 [Sesamum angolense]|uniref:Uncharacterized protein n=1 Tax=Sesamum angolense TaxID=2727404 RepID=A0AAE1T8Q8_9LAMI|nr:hypothetical protein Sango_2760700 [Sesamum angolense]
MELLRDFLLVYELVLGQLINGSKSSFIVGRQTSSLQTQAVQDVLGYQLKHLPVTYLGVPLYKGKRKACLFDLIIIQLRDLLQGWAMNLSHGGRLALIRSVLQATPLLLLQVIHPPKSVLITIECIFNGFFGARIMGVSTFIGLLGQRHVFRWRKVEWVSVVWQTMSGPFPRGCGGGFGASHPYGRSTCMVATVEICIRLLCLIIVIIPRFGIASVVFEMWPNLLSSGPWVKVLFLFGTIIGLARSPQPSSCTGYLYYRADKLLLA